MVENLVDAWLTEASERSYEAAFCQLLVIEGHRVVQGPMHHAYEHGKDLIAWNPGEELCVYQLKGGPGRLGLGSFEKIQRQLFAAATAVVRHPSLGKPRRPDRVYLITNQEATGPVHDRLSAMSEGNRAEGLATLHMVEHAELCSRFVDAAGRFFPSSPEGLSVFLALALADGRDELPRRDFFRLLEEILPLKGNRPRAAETGRAIAAAALTTAFALQKWSEYENFSEIIIGWSCYATQVLRVAEKCRLGHRWWKNPYRLALEEARRNAAQLLEEAVNSEDLIIPHEGESLVYAARAVKVCGLVSALAVSERIEFASDAPLGRRAAELVLRERQFFLISGEAQAAEYFLAILAVEASGDEEVAAAMLLSWVASVARANQVGSQVPVPDPYHSAGEILEAYLAPLGTFLVDESFVGSAYTVHIGVRWASRRLLRGPLDSVWPEVSRLSHHSFEPPVAVDYLAPETRRGRLASWFYRVPTSWSELRSSAAACDTSTLPRALLSCPEFLPLLLPCSPAPVQCPDLRSCRSTGLSLDTQARCRRVAVAGAKRGGRVGSGRCPPLASVIECSLIVFLNHALGTGRCDSLTLPSITGIRPAQVHMDTEVCRCVPTLIYFLHTFM